jgi:hypothetical protein
VSRGRGSRKECIYIRFEEARAEAVKIHGGEGKLLEFVFGSRARIMKLIVATEVLVD